MMRLRWIRQDGTLSCSCLIQFGWLRVKVMSVQMRLNFCTASY